MLGRLYSEFVKSIVITTTMVLIAWPFRVHRERHHRIVLLVLMIAFWAVVFSGFMQLIALKTQRGRNQRGEPDLLPAVVPHPNFVPRELLARPMDTRPRSAQSPTSWRRPGR